MRIFVAVILTSFFSIFWFVGCGKTCKSIVDCADLGKDYTCEKPRNDKTAPGVCVKKEPTQGEPTQDEPADEPVTTKEEPAVTKEEPAVSKEEPTVTKEEPVATKEETVSKEETTVVKEESTVVKEETTTKEEAAISKEEPTVTKEEPVVTKEESTVVKEETSAKEETVAETTTKEETSAKEETVAETTTKEESTVVKEETTTKEETVAETTVDASEPVVEAVVEKVVETPQDTNQTPSKPVQGDLIINELHTDPDSSALKGDANKDGLRHSTHDEFVEIVNASNKALDMEGVEVLVVKSKKTFKFPAMILPAKGVVVIFGGGLVGDQLVGSKKKHPKFGDAYVFIKTLTLTNSGTTVELKDSSGTVLDSFKYGGTTCKGDKNQSVVRKPDLTTGTCDLHKNINANAAFSPGTRTDGTKF